MAPQALVRVRPVRIIDIRVRGEIDSEALDSMFVFTLMCGNATYGDRTAAGSDPVSRAAPYSPDGHLSMATKW